MTLPPLPENPCLRVAIGQNHDTGLKGGSRFYLSYAGSAPTGSDCTGIATDIAAAWNTNIIPLTNSDWALVEVDVLDIATRSGNSGQWTGSHGGTRSGTPMPAQTAANIEFGIAPRYRGGKPRIFLTPGVTSDASDDATWGTSYLTALESDIVAFFTAVEAISVGAVGALNHVVISYYHLFTNITNTSGRTRAAPKYRPDSPGALVYPVNGYFPKARIGSQRRRRASTTF